MRAFLGCVLGVGMAASGFGQTVRVTLPVGTTPLDGRLMVLLSNDASQEPRMQINDTPASQMVFAVTLDGAKPGSVVTVGEDGYGYPVRHLSEVPPGDYTAQVVLNLYTTYHRADGHTVKLAADRGEGHHWNEAPGNPMSLPKKVHVEGRGTRINLVLDHTIPAIAPIVDTKYVRRLRIQSAVLTKFWGTPMFLSATVLVPEGFDEHPNARFPVMIFHDHFNDGFSEFRTTPPDPYSYTAK